MKKYKSYILLGAALVIGLCIGYLIFGNSTTNDKNTGTTAVSDAEEIYTCSMHPQIRHKGPGKCPICGMDLIPANQTDNESNIRLQMTEDAVKLANIQTTVIGGSAENTSGTLKLNGKIQTDETGDASIVTHIPGRIERLYASFTGEQINKGQRIASIYSPDLITAQKELLEAKKLQNTSPGLLEAAKNKLRYWKISNQTIESILKSNAVRETFDIYADFSGVISRKRVSVGDYLPTGGVLFDVQNLNRLWALFDVYENDLPKVGVGSIVHFTTPSEPDKTYSAKISFVNPVIDPSTRTATIRAEVGNGAGKLKPEMFIVGELNVGNPSTRSEALSVPKSAVLWTGERSVVYVKVPNTEVPTFEFREIELGESTTDSYRVVSGLKSGDEVVTNGAFVIDASAQLNNQASMMNQNVTVKYAATEASTSSLPDYTAQTPKAFQSQLSDLANAYLHLKDALIATDSQKAAANTKTMLSQLGKVDMTLLKGDAHEQWMKLHNIIKTNAQAMTESKDVEKQRTQFAALSQALIQSLKTFGVSSATYYVQHCPMAMNKKGADWLSKQTNILNPYFGKKMLTCGSVKDTIQ